MHEIMVTQGSLTILLRKIHGGIFNTLIVPEDTPDEWFFKQFPSEELIFEYALTNKLSVRREERSDQHQSE